MPSFTKAKTFAKCQLMSFFFKLLLLFLLFLLSICVSFLTYFVTVAVGFKQLCIHHVEYEDLSCKKRNTNKKKRHRSGLKTIEKFKDILSKTSSVIKLDFLTWQQLTFQAIHLSWKLDKLLPCQTQSTFFFLRSFEEIHANYLSSNLPPLTFTAQLTWRRSSSSVVYHDKLNLWNLANRPFA